MSHQDILKCLRILYSEDIAQYDEHFLETLHQNYDVLEKFEDLREQGNDFFLKFVEEWPYFLHSNKMIEGLLDIV